MTDPKNPAAFEQVDLSGAQLRKVDLTGSVFRMVDLTGAVLRDVSLAEASIDGSDLTGLRIDGVEVAPLVEAELTRREPARALRRAPDPAGLRAAWAALEQSWAATYTRAAALPTRSVEVSVLGEWSFAQTLRHLVFVTDAWLGEPLGQLVGDGPRWHPWGVPFTDVAEFVAPADLGIDLSATPSYAEVLDLRAGRVAAVHDLLAAVTAQQLAEPVAGPPWAGAEPVSLLRCVWVVLTEECDHHRFAERDLDAIARY